jgi:hypothetical protein
MGKAITGKGAGSLVFATSTTAGASGKLTLDLSRGSFALAEPFLGLTRIDFDRGNLQATIENGIMKIEKLQISGKQLDCFLNAKSFLLTTLKTASSASRVIWPYRIKK